MTVTMMITMTMTMTMIANLDMTDSTGLQWVVLAWHRGEGGRGGACKSPDS